MLIGVLSDSHSRVEITRKAVELLVARGADTLIHLGDVGNEHVLDEFIGHRAYVVFGNCDWDIAGLTRHAECMGITVAHPLGWLDIEGRRVAFTHGHLPHLMQQAIDSGADFLLHGHTHDVRDERLDRTRVINPGALFRAARYTAALLDPAADRLSVFDVNSPSP